jgi:hypothetical protein
MADHTDPEVFSIATDVGERVAIPAPGETLGNTLTKTVGGASVVPVPLPAAARDGVAPGEGDFSEGTMLVPHVSQLADASDTETSRQKLRPSRMAAHSTQLASVPRVRRGAATVIAGAVAVAILLATLIWALGTTGNGDDAKSPEGPGALGAGVVRLTSTPAAEIAWRGQTLGVTPIDLEFPAGTHRLTVTQQAPQRASTILVRVAPGSRITRLIDLQSATLTVVATPSADATLDGVRLGPTPLTRLHVEPGEHVVELFESRSGIRKRIPVTLEPSHDHEMTLDFGSGR